MEWSSLPGPLSVLYWQKKNYKLPFFWSLIVLYAWGFNFNLKCFPYIEEGGNEGGGGGMKERQHNHQQDSGLTRSQTICNQSITKINIPILSRRSLYLLQIPLENYLNLSEALLIYLNERPGTQDLFTGGGHSLWGLAHCKSSCSSWSAMRRSHYGAHKPRGVGGG